jgi:hypothetical protein
MYDTTRTSGRLPALLFQARRKRVYIDARAHRRKQVDARSALGSFINADCQSNLTSIKWTKLSLVDGCQRQTNGGTPRSSKPPYINHESASFTIADWSIGRNSLLSLRSSLPLSCSRSFPVRVFSSRVSPRFH